MGASARTLDITFRAVGVDAVRSGFRQVGNDARAVGGQLKEAGEGAEGLGHSAVIGLGELSRGIGRIAESGQASSFAMRELSGGIMRLGQALGPGAGLIGIFAILGGVIVETFMKARAEMKKTEEEFQKSIATMANAGRGQDLIQQSRDLYFGTPYDENGNLRNPSAVQGAFQGSLADLRSRMANLKAKLLPSGFLSNDLANAPVIKAMKELQPLLDEAEKKFRAINTALDVMQSRPATIGILPMKSTAQRPLTDEQIEKNERELTKLIDFAEGAANRFAIESLPVRVTPGVGPFVGSLLGGADKILGGKGPKIAKIVKDQYDQIAEEELKQQKAFGRMVQQGLAQTIGSAITDGIMAGFDEHSIGSAFKSAGKAILAGLGGIFEQMGAVWIQYGIMMTSLGEALWNPLTSGPAAIAIGIGLTALGAALGAIAHGRSGGGSYGGSGGSLPNVTTTAYLTTGAANAATQGRMVVPQKPVVNNITLLGDDPASVRKLQAMLDRNARLSGAA